VTKNKAPLIFFEELAFGVLLFMMSSFNIYLSLMFVDLSQATTTAASSGIQQGKKNYFFAPAKIAREKKKPMPDTAPDRSDPSFAARVL